MRRTTRMTLIIYGVLTGLVAMLAGAACTPEEAPARTPPPPPSSGMELTAQAADTFTVLATWPPVVFEGDTIRQYRRTFTRTDATQSFPFDDNASVNSIGSETLVIPAPAEGETASYRYCLRSVRADGVTGRDSTCASFQYTAPTSFPPPPDSIAIDTAVAMAADSVTLDPDSLVFTYHVTEAGDTVWDAALAYVGGLQVDSVAGHQYQLRARVWRDGEVVGCAGRCGDQVVHAAKFVAGVPFYFGGRPGYPVGEEWRAVRLPWLRMLAGA